MDTKVLRVLRTGDFLQHIKLFYENALYKFTFHICHLHDRVSPTTYVFIK